MPLATAVTVGRQRLSLLVGLQQMPGKVQHMGATVALAAFRTWASAVTAIVRLLVRRVATAAAVVARSRRCGGQIGQFAQAQQAVGGFFERGLGLGHLPVEFDGQIHGCDPRQFLAKTPRRY